MPRMIAKGWPIAKPRPLSYHVKCHACSCTCGRFVAADNELSVDSGPWADYYRNLGWTFDPDDGWRCPEC